MEKNDIASVTLFFTVLIALVNGLDLLAGKIVPPLEFNSALTGGRWSDILFFPFRIASSWFSFAILLYMNWIFGSYVEEEMSPKRYVAFLFSGYVFIFIGTSFYPLDGSLIFLSIFLAAAWRMPEEVIYLFFFIPVQLKWAAWISLGLFLLGPLWTAYSNQTPFPLIGSFLCLLNFLIFHGSEIIQRIRN